MLVVDLADQIYRENMEPKDTGIPAIAYWIRSNIGKLNLLTYENFCVDFQGGTYEILKPGCADTNKGFNHLAAAIMVLIFKIYRIELDIRNIMFGITHDSVIIAKDQEYSITRINKSEVLKTLTAFKKDTLAELTMMVHYYRSYEGTVSAISGDDFIPGFFRSIESTLGNRNDFVGI